jgi:FixJ family two-component response regulator
MDQNTVVFLLDDDSSVLHALERLLQASGFEVHAWTSAFDFLAEHDPATPGCLVTDVVMPDMSGLDLHRALVSTGSERPIIFITGHGSIPMSVQAMKAGAISFLPKPIRAADLLTAVREAISKDVLARAVQHKRYAIVERIERLTPRERQVIELVAQGMLNKQIAGQLGAAEKTIKVHRGRAMEKLQVRSAAALVGLLSRAQADSSPETLSLPPQNEKADTRLPGDPWQLGLSL